MKQNIEIWNDDTVEEVIDQFTFALIEVGIQVKKVDINQESVIYEVSRAETL
jgi:uncharacterized protein YcsI (UPF0317 family)